MTLGIIAAMDLELRELQALMKRPKTEVVGGIAFIRGKIEGHTVVTAVSGVGKVFAAMCAQTMILRYKPDAVVNVGVAGTLTHRLGIMDVAVADRVCQYDLDTSALGDPAGLISGINKVYIPTDVKLTHAIRTSALRLMLPCVTGAIASGDTFVEVSEVKQLIRNQFDAIAVEMEGASIGQVCFVNDVPFAVIRTISDGEGAAVDYDAFAPAAAQNSISVLLEFLKGLGKEQIC